MNLAILRTLAPIGNYEVAIEILNYAQDILDDERVSLIGFFISLTWHGDPSVFIDKMMFFYRVCNEKYKSMVDYLLTLQAYYEDENNKMIQLPKQSDFNISKSCKYFFIISKILQ